MLRRTLNFTRLLPAAHCSPTPRATAAAILARPAARPLCEKAGDLSISERNRRRAQEYLQKDVPATLRSPDLEDEASVHASARREQRPPPAAAQSRPRGGEADADGGPHPSAPRTRAILDAHARVRKHVPHLRGGGRPSAADIRTLLEGAHGAQRVVTLDVRAAAGFADWLVVASALSARHAVAVADGLRSDMRSQGVGADGGGGGGGGGAGRPVELSGRNAGEWVVVDVGDVVVHVMTDEVRAHYRLEELWGGDLSGLQDGGDGAEEAVGVRASLTHKTTKG